MDEPATRRLSPDAAAAAFAAAPRELAAGDVIDEWAIARRLAGGGFGSVYEVHHRTSRQRAALKLLHAHLVTSVEMRARFEREIEVIRRLSHPNIVQLVASGADADGRPYLCMELLDGEELGRVIQHHGHLAPPLAVAILEALCDALATAHAAGIVHRDIKAANVFVCRAAPGATLGRIVLLDFGIAKLSDAFATELTATAQALGTPSCMAPEQIHGRRADARTDVYALGALLFQMLTGQPALHDPSPTMTQYLHLHARRPRASAVQSVPARLDDVIIRAMAIEPAERYGDARELFAAARAALRESGVVQTVLASESTAILVTARDRGGGAALDEAVLSDLESVLPDAERVLAAAGYTLALDLGASSLFVARLGAEAATEAAAATWAHLQRTSRSARVQVSVCVHRGPLVVSGQELQPSPLLRPATWHVPDDREGLWVTGAIDPSAPDGKRIA